MVENFAQKKSDLETQKAEAQASFDGEKVGELEQALADLDAKQKQFEATAENAGAITENQEKQITELGGDKEVVAEKTTEVDAKIEDVKEEVKQVEETVENASSETKIKEGVEVYKNDSIEKPKKIEDIPAYLDVLKQRFDQIPGEYEAAVSVLLQNIQTEDEKEVINRMLGISETNTKKEEIDSTRESILGKYKDVNKEYIGNGGVDDTLQFIAEKHPDTKSSYDAMQALRSEKNQLKMEKSQYDEVLQLAQDPETLKNYFDFTGSDGMIRSRAQYRLEVAKKLIDLGVLDESKVAQEFEKWVEKTKTEDLGKWKPEDQEKEMELFRGVYKKIIEK